MKILVPKKNTLDKDSKLNNARMSEFIVDMKTGDFVTEWDVYTKNADGTYNFNPKDYTNEQLREIANTESFNYGPSIGKNGDLSKEEKEARAHKYLDEKQPADPDIRALAKSEWKSEKDYDDGGNYADIVKVGERDVNAWNKVPEKDRQKVYNDFVDHCRNHNNTNNGFEYYCKEEKLYGYK